MTRHSPFSAWIGWVACLVACACALLAEGRASADEAIETVEALWAGFDPRRDPLEIEVVKAWDEGDVHLEMVYFTGETFEGEKTRVFAYVGRPKAVVGKVPGVLHIHGGGQTAVLDWPRFWAKRGYACVSFDFCGAGAGREHYTRWGKIQGDMVRISGGLNMKPTPRHNPWYHWMLTARRGLTLLESRPGVDGGKLGVFGVSVGGTLTWGVAAVDSRVKAAAPIYGCGWEFYPYPPDPAAPVDPDLKLWRTLIAPEAMAPRVACPLLLLSATNDGHGRMDLAYRTLDRLASPVRGAVFSPNYDHHVEPAEGRSLPAFMDAHLKDDPKSWPSTPGLEMRGGGDEPLARVRPADAANVERVDVFYCLSNDWPTTRFWRTAADARREGGEFVAATPFLAPEDVLFVFANVTYKSGARISSRLVRQPVAELAGVRPSLKRQALIDAMETSTDWNWVPAYTDPCRDDRFFTEWRGDGGEIGFTLDPKTIGHGGAMPYYFGTRKIGDPQFRGTGRKALLLDHPAANTPDRLTIRLTVRPPGQLPSEFKSTLGPSAGSGAWRTWTMEPGQFRDAAGKTLAVWDHVEFFVLEGTNPANHPPVFKRLRWGENEADDRGAKR
jgi:dienelactone hydrolase